MQGLPIFLIMPALCFLQFLCHFGVQYRNFVGFVCNLVYFKGALFLELWKRYSAEITHRWDLTGFDVQEEHPRPQYLARLAHVKRQEVNVVTNIMEPHVPFWRLRVPVTIFSFSVVMLLVINL